ncbi:MAG: hypothetical protein IPL35_01085 [Sphingobacteriales bacterium]|nr:hypothetical protein [Sphingobacteriales bacterium]
MIRKSWLPLLCAASLWIGTISCKNEFKGQTVRTTQLSKLNDTTELYSFGEVRYTGRAVEYYDNGSPKLIMYLEDGIPFQKTGYYNSKSEEKQKSYEILYRSDGTKKERKDWYSNGKKKLEMYFNAQDQIDGTFTEWYPIGTVKSVMRYEEGKKHGLHAEWYQSGKKKMETEYRNGKIVAIEDYTPNKKSNQKKKGLGRNLFK